MLMVYVSNPPDIVGVYTGGMINCWVYFGMVLGFRVGPSGGTGLTAKVIVKVVVMIVNIINIPKKIDVFVFNIVIPVITEL